MTRGWSAVAMSEAPGFGRLAHHPGVVTTKVAAVGVSVVAGAR